MEEQADAAEPMPASNGGAPEPGADGDAEIGLEKDEGAGEPGKVAAGVSSHDDEHEKRPASPFEEQRKHSKSPPAKDPASSVERRRRESRSPARRRSRTPSMDRKRTRSVTPVLENRRRSETPPVRSRDRERVRDREVDRDTSRRDERRSRGGRSRSPGYRRRSSSPSRRSPPRRRSRDRYGSGSRRGRRESDHKGGSNGIGRPGNNLFIAGFNFITTEKDLEKKFSKYGKVVDVRIVRDPRSRESRGFGFVTLETDEDADDAIREEDQASWNGRIVLVEKAKNPR